MNNKGIDIVVPVYNGSKFILEALESAARQTFSPNKIIVVDDGSTDNTNKIASEYAKNSSVEIKIIKKENGGLSSARNAGIKESGAEFVAFLDADDVWIENKLEEQIKVFQTTGFKNLALVYCDYDVIDSNGVVRYKNYKAPLDKRRMRGMVFKELLERNKITSSGSGVLVKRHVFDSVGLFDEKLRWGEDWDMWLRITEKFEVDFVPKVLVHIRKHEDNMTYDPSKIFETELDFYNKWTSVIAGRYPRPYFWKDKITFRIISGLGNTKYQKKFKETFGSFYLYIPIFLVRQIWNIIFYPNYIRILMGLIKYRGK